MQYLRGLLSSKVLICSCYIGSIRKCKSILCSLLKFRFLFQQRENLDFSKFPSEKSFITLTTELLASRVGLRSRWLDWIWKYVPWNRYLSTSLSTICNSEKQLTWLQNFQQVTTYLGTPVQSLGVSNEYLPSCRCITYRHC